MVSVGQLNCGPIKPNSKYQTTKLAFGNQKQEIVKPKESLDIEPKAKENVTQDKPFNIKRAGVNFWKGVTSPIQQAIDHPVATGIIASIGFGIKKLAEKADNKYQKLGLIALGVTTSVSLYNIGKGIYDLATGKTAKAKEDSFYDLGQGTVYGAMAVAPAKNIALANKLIEPNSNVNRLQALKICITKGIPDTIKSLGQASIGQISFKEALSAPIVVGTEFNGGDINNLNRVTSKIKLDNVEVSADVKEVLPDAAQELLERTHETVERFSSDRAPIPIYPTIKDKLDDSEEK